MMLNVDKSRRLADVICRTTTQQHGNIVKDKRRREQHGEDINV